MTGTRASVEERLWRRVERRGPDECWPWLGACHASGHGKINPGWFGASPIGTHRVAWESANGPIPAGLLIRHVCDNPPCCNPAHLLLGTKLDNARDAVERGRAATEFRQPNTKISNADVLFIRENYLPSSKGHPSNAAELAAMFGVSDRHISRIARGKRRSGPHIPTRLIRELIEGAK